MLPIFISLAITDQGPAAPAATVTLQSCAHKMSGGAMEELLKQWQAARDRKVVTE